MLNSVLAVVPVLKPIVPFLFMGMAAGIILIAAGISLRRKGG